MAILVCDVTTTNELHINNRFAKRGETPLPLNLTINTSHGDIENRISDSFLAFSCALIEAILGFQAKYAIKDTTEQSKDE